MASVTLKLALSDAKMAAEIMERVADKVASKGRTLTHEEAAQAFLYVSNGAYNHGGTAEVLRVANAIRTAVKANA